MSGEARLRVDWTACGGAGLCHELLPELLAEDPWGYPLMRSGERDVAVPANLEGHAKRAVKTCPRLALRLESA